MPTTGGDAPRMLAMLQRLLAQPAAELATALTHAANTIADALGADKVDAFLYDESRDSLVAVGASTQPLTNLQRRLGLDVLPISNGGRAVQAYLDGKAFRAGNVQDDPGELRGVREGLKVASEIGIPLVIGERKRGLILISSLRRDHFTEADARFAESAAHWVGMVAHRAGLVRDIEANALEQGRRAAAEELVTVLAHDLRNFVSPIAGQLHVLRHRAEEAKDAEGRQRVESALRGVHRLGALISDLLDVARIDRGLFELDIAPVDLCTLARDAAAVLSTSAHEIKVSASMPIMVAGDRARLRQCLDNLLANALAHSPARAPVNVFVSVDGEGGAWGQVEVVDEGPGIPQEVLPRLFERFATGRAKQGGMGLGLYLAQRVAKAHRGELRAESPPGQGARFRLRIPLWREAA